MQSDEYITEDQREDIAQVLERIAEDGLKHPRNLDAAIDTILQIIFEEG